MALPKRLMTIAGSAAGGSAGIQADLKTYEELDVYGMSIITAIVGKHPESGKNVHMQTVEAIEAQFATALHQVGVDGVKTGMLFSRQIIERVAKLLEDAQPGHLTVDPVMIGKMDSKLLEDDAICVLAEKLIPQADIITPNMPEASILLGRRELKTIDDLQHAAADLYKLGARNVLVKGGRLEGPAVDVLYDGKSMTMLEAPRIPTRNTSGAGCTYSAAIAALMTKGYAAVEAVRMAKSFVTTAIAHGFSYTETVGPTLHAAERKFGEAYGIEVSTIKG